MGSGRIAAGLRRLAEAVDLWRRGRRSRAELARLNPYQLRDIGITPGAVIAETGEPFWPPRGHL